MFSLVNFTKHLMKKLYQFSIISSSRTGKKKQIYALSLHLFNIVLELLASTIRQEKNIKGMQIRKEEIKLLIFRGYDRVPRKA